MKNRPQKTGKLTEKIQSQKTTNKKENPQKMVIKLREN